MVLIEGKGCISAKIIADSCSSSSPSRLTTFEITYPRFIHSEFLTHRLFSRNAASSRAIPVKAMLEQVRSNPAMPIHWGANQSGMQAKDECNNTVYLKEVLAWEAQPDADLFEVVDLSYSREDAWFVAAEAVADIAESFSKAGYHKQIVNRLLEPFQIMKTVVTATEFDNFFYLRCHADAQPEIKALAECMYQALQQSTAEVLKPGEWHVPYVNTSRDAAGKRYYWNFISDTEKLGITLEQALKISASCCAQVSYRKSDDSLEKALLVYDRLVESKPVHASPFEHQGSPMKGVDTQEPDGWQFLINHSGYPGSWEVGITHSDRDGRLWSGNFKSWIQYRQMIKDNVCWEYPVGVQDEE
jgi:hypothetical protein